MSEKIYRVQMNSSGMPNFSTAVEIADRPQGEWVRYMGDIWTCTACGESLMCDDIECNNFCPNCGARMFAKDTNVPNKKGADDE